MKRLIGKATQARNSGGNALEQSADSAAEVPLEDAVEQLSTVLARVAKGDLGARAVLQQGPPEARKLGHDLNTVLDLFESYMRETDATVRAAAEGRLHRVVLQRGMPGQFASGARGVNEVRAALVEAEADRERRTSVRMAMADEVSHAAEGLAEVADRLGGSAGAMTESAKTAAQASSAAGATVEELRTASMQIEAAVHVVAQVANQTRLLALNASIEAARAGEAGKGFAVVAGEVKNLADETADSTDGIRTQVLRAQHAANQAATALAALGQAVETMNDRIGDVTADLGQDGLAGLSSNLQARIHELNK